MKAGQAPVNPTDAPISPAAISTTVTARSLRGVIHEKPLAASHALMPVAPAAAVEAASMHCAHMRSL